MSILRIKFPSEQDRLRRRIEADRGKSFRQRVLAIDGLLSTIAQFRVAGDEIRPSVRDKREAEFRAYWYELAQRARSGR
jgi:hypothetical protein